MKTVSVLLFALSQQVIHTSATPLLPRAVDAASKASTPLCNKVGWDKGIESFESTTSGGYTACSTSCKALSQCKAFAYTHADGGEWESDCQLYDVPLKNNFVDDSNSPYTFFDIGCESVSTTCGDMGYYVDKYAYVWVDTANFPERQNVKWCYNYCQTWGDKCKSFAFDPYHCILYDVPTVGNFEKSADGSGRAFYDVSCGSVILGSATTTTATTKPTTTTTTTTKTSTKTTKTTTTTTTTTTSKKTTTTTTTTTPKATTTTPAKTTTTTKAPTTTTKAPTTTVKTTTTTKAGTTTKGSY